MMRFGYTLMTEQSGPRELVAYAAAAEQRGFDLAVSSDHYSPWLPTQGHAPYAWTMLGAVAQATESIELMTYVTCPSLRYHPAVVAQKAATVQLLAEGRFVLGLGSGERLNEHVVGQGWPGVPERHDRLVESIEIIRALHGGGTVDYVGRYIRVDSARVWDLPERPVEPAPALIEAWNARSDTTRIGEGARAIGQLPISWDPSSIEAATERAHDQFRWFAGGWRVNADLPTPGAFEAASAYVRPEDVAKSIPCGPDLDAIVEAVAPWHDAGFTDLAFVQVGDERQQDFLDHAAEPLLEKLRATYG